MSDRCDQPTRPSILVFNRHYLPGYRAGGPIRTLSLLVDALSDQFDFHIVTNDRDLGIEVPYDGITAGQWYQVGRAHVVYLARASVTMAAVVRLVKEVRPAAIYLNSCLDSWFSVRVLVARRLGRLGKVPVILAPRGELASGALGLKPLKKLAYLGMANRTGLFAGLVWHATTDCEKADILTRIRSASPEHVRIAGNLTESPGLNVNDGPLGEAVLRVCFFARVSPVKNLAFALRVLARVSCPVRFTILGPLEHAAHWAECRQLIAQLPPHVEAVYEGEVRPEEVATTLRAHDLMFLPTLGENFGHTIYEALAAGVPVLISDRTPWNGLQDHGAGWALPLDAPTRFGEVLEAIAAMSTADRSAMRSRASAFAALRAGRTEAIAAARLLFSKVAAG